MKVCLTGGIASGKSLLSCYLNELGVKTIDADDIVHTIIPKEERERLRKIVFTNPDARKELEERIHPLVRQKILDFLALNSPSSPIPPIAIIPLLFEVQWEKDYDIIICVLSSREKQIERMTALRGYSRAEAEARLAAQMDPTIKAAKSDYVILNDSTDEDLKAEAIKLVEYLVSRSKA